MAPADDICYLKLHQRDVASPTLYDLTMEYHGTERTAFALVEQDVGSITIQVHAQLFRAMTEHLE